MLEIFYLKFTLFIFQIEVVDNLFMKKEYFEKAKAAKNIKCRINCMMHSYWTDDQAPQFCLKTRVNQPHLQEQINLNNLNPIKSM